MRTDWALLEGWNATTTDAVISFSRDETMPHLTRPAYPEDLLLRWLEVLPFAGLLRF